MLEISLKFGENPKNSTTNVAGQCTTVGLCVAYSKTHPKPVYHALFGSSSSSSSGFDRCGVVCGWFVWRK